MLEGAGQSTWHAPDHHAGLLTIGQKGKAFNVLYDALSRREEGMPERVPDGTYGLFKVLRMVAREVGTARGRGAAGTGWK